MAMALVTSLAAVAGAQTPAAQMRVGAEAQEDLAITVYNNNYGLVREVRRMTLPIGEIELEFSDVAEKIDPTSVAFKSLDAPDRIGILEQNYRYDLLNPSTLLDKYVGREIKLTRLVRDSDGADRAVTVSGTLLSTNGGRIVRVGDEILINPPGEIVLAEVPEDLVANPTLVWRLANQSAEPQRVETSYLTNDMSWKADYVAVVNSDDSALDWTGWVTLDNRSGTTYRNARLKLVAGDVQRIQPPQPRAVRGRVEMLAMAEAQFTEESFFEYHLYTLERRATIAHNETKQMTLLEGTGVGAVKRYVLESGAGFIGPRGGGQTNQVKLAVKLEFVNARSNGLGVPLPKGRVRVYKADSDRALQLIGEDQIDHTPRDEKVRLKLGEAFDVVGERAQTDFRQLSDRRTESSYVITIRNHKSEAISATVVERAYGDWIIRNESQPSVKRDSTTFEYTVPVAANGEATVSYTIQIGN
jgi:hypothetical protein